MGSAADSPALSQRVDVVIAARNEESRIGAVIAAARAARCVGSILAVVNGSNDQTAAIARELGVEVLELPEANKGRAILTALTLVNSSVVCLLDADLCDLSPAHIEALIVPVLDDPSIMTCGILPNRRGRLTLRHDFLWFFSLSGQRACRVDLLRELEPRRASGYRIEVALNSLAYRRNVAIRRIGFSGVRHIQRELKEFPTRKPVKWFTIAHCYAQYGYLLASEFARFCLPRVGRPLSVPADGV